MESNEMQAGGASAPQMSAFGRIIGVFTSPGKTFASIDARPTWLIPVILYSIVSLSFFYIAYDIILNETLTQQNEAMIDQGMDQEQIDTALERVEWGFKYFGAVSSMLFPFILLLIIAGIFLFVGNVILGGKSTYKKVLSVTAHSWLIFVVSAIVALPIVLSKETVNVSFSLAMLLSEEGKGTFFYQLLAKIDLFAIWFIAVYSIGLAVIYKMRTQKMAMAVVSVYAIYALIFSALGK